MSGTIAQKDTESMGRLSAGQNEVWGKALYLEGSENKVGPHGPLGGLDGIMAYLTQSLGAESWDSGSLIRHSVAVAEVALWLRAL